MCPDSSPAAELSFVKMQGCGNDYIYFDCFSQSITHPEELAVRLSDRHFSIGGDGIVLICPSDVADAKMRMFNADGSEGKMCGNAIRCVGKYLHDIKGLDKPEMTIETLSGIKTLYLTVTDGTVSHVSVDMGMARWRPDEIPAAIPGEKIVDWPLDVEERTYRVTCVSMGNPHCVVFCTDVQSLNLADIGPAFEHHPLFPERINTEFVRVIDKHHLQMRVWERGSGETMACGTGACASVAAAVAGGFCRYDEPVTVSLLGGDLTVTYARDGHVRLSGGAQIAFRGSVTV